MDLGGTWAAALVDQELIRTGADPDLDHSGWATVQVPGHWGETDAFLDTDGPVLYRRTFIHEVAPAPTRTWLYLGGVIAQSDVWINGAYVGSTNGYFVPHRFDVTDVLAKGQSIEHVISIEVTASEQNDDRTKKSFTGSLQAGPLAPAGCPGGIWQSIRLEETGSVGINHARLLCTDANPTTAELKLRVVLDSQLAGEIEVVTSVTGPNGKAVAGGTQTFEVAQGENRLEWDTTVDAPELWWPASRGEQPLYDVAVLVGDPDGGRSDRREWRTGLRRVNADGFTWRVNGERLFAKGISIGPQSRFLANFSADRVAEDLRAVRAAGLDLIRVHGHIAPSALYEEADRLGLLVWQDLPLVGGYAITSRRTARATARETVDLLGHHPSVAVWCAHDEPNGQPLPQPAAPGSGTQKDDRGEAVRSESLAPSPLPSFGRSLGRHLLPSWNRSVLDPIIRRELRSADATRTVIARSGSLPMLTDASGSDAHLWLGWHNGAPEDLTDVLKSWPRLGGFLGGFGAQSVAEQWWDEDEPTWPRSQPGAFERYLPRRAYGDGMAWALATRAYQSDLIRRHIETLRRLKYRPTGGFCLMALSDAEPEGGFGVLEFDRTPKPAFAALTDACRPVVVITDVPPHITSAGEQLRFDVHTVSDLPTELTDVTVTAIARCGSWEKATSWRGNLPADTCQLAGTLAFEVPPLNGILTIDLELRAAEWSATNRYQTVVIPPAETLKRTGV